MQSTTDISTPTASEEVSSRLNSTHFLAQTCFFTEFKTKSGSEKMGHYGTVYLGRINNIFVAAKGFKTSSIFIKETEVVLALDSPYIPAPLATCFDPYYLISEWVDGGNLEDFLKSHKQDTWLQIGIALDTCHAVKYLHDHGWIHRDIKPANILLTQAGRAKLTDFNLSEKNDGKEKDSCGSPMHMAPELFTTEKISGDLTSCDIYSIGIVLWAMVLSHNTLKEQPSDVAEKLMGSLKPVEEKFSFHHKEGDIRRAIEQSLSTLEEKNNPKIKMLGNFILLCTHPKPLERCTLALLITTLEEYIRENTYETSWMRQYLAPPPKVIHKGFKTKIDDSSYAWVGKKLMKVEKENSPPVLCDAKDVQPQIKYANLNQQACLFYSQKLYASAFKMHHAHLIHQVTNVQRDSAILIAEYAAMVPK